MIKWIKRNWTDPVWSKVIAFVITIVISNIFLFLWSVFQSIPVQDSYKEVIKFLKDTKYEVNLFTIVVIGVPFIILLLTPRIISMIRTDKRDSFSLGRPANGGKIVDGNLTNVLITNGLLMWLDASDISSLFQERDGKQPVTAGNPLVGLWIDKSENENHFMQPLHEARPLFVKTGIGGKPSIAFNTKQSIFLTRSFPAPVTVIYVAKQTGGSNNRVLSAMTNNWLLGYWSGAKNQAFYEEWVSPKGIPDTDNLPHVFSGIVRGPGRDSEVWADGAMVATNQNGIKGPNGLAINTGQYSKEVSDCQVAEIIVFNRDISQSERQKVEADLKAKWDIKY